ncbi:MAG: hypothetical protein ACK4UJ_08260 [Leptonema sp. (in: bacteria)]
MKCKVIFLIFFIVFSHCQSPQIYKNFSDYKKLEEIAVLEFDGYQIKIQDETKSYYDILLLLEGNYLIEFRDRNSLIKGAALCELKANSIYTIEIEDKRNFPKYNKSIYIGKCKKVEKDKTNLIEKYFLDKKL